MEDISFRPMDLVTAEEITSWRYPPPYHVYNFYPDAHTFSYLLDGSFFVAFRGKQLLGFCCYGQHAQVPHAATLGLYQSGRTDFGLALCPDLVGQGLGASFVRAGMEFGRQLFGLPLRLTVAQFNQRAIHVYLSQGFVPHKSFLTPDGRGFVIMMEQKSNQAV